MKKTYHYILWLTLIQFSPISNANNAGDELLLAYIYKLSKFVNWPEDMFAPNDTINMCFYGGLGGLQQKISQLDDLSINNHPIITNRIARGEEINGCQILYISDSEEIYFRPLLEKIKGKPILTFSTSNNFIKADGMIALVYYNDRLGFDINQNAIRESNLAISSQVLRLARKVMK